jgi:hypothetical protein
MNISRKLALASATTLVATMVGAGLTTTPAAAATVPTAPATCSAQIVTGGVNVTWTAPTSDGGAAIDHYAVKIKGDPTFTDNTIPATARSWLWQHPYATSDTMQVRAVNSIGFGPWCETTIAPPANNPPSVNAGADQTISLPSGNGPATTSLDGTVTDTDGPGPLVSAWTETSGPGTVTFTPNNSGPDTTASFPVAGTYVLALTANDGRAGATDSMTVTVTPVNTATVPGAPATCQATDQGSSVLVVWTPPASDGGSPIIRYAVKVKGGATTIQVNDPAARSYVWTGAYLPTDIMQVRAVNSVGFGAWCETAITGGPPPTNQAPTVSAGADQSIVLPSSASLNGTVTDDGLPAGSTLTSTWSQVSGPGTVTFGNANAEDTTASFSTDGTYVLRLTGSDGTLSTSDDMTVTVAPQGPTNQPPTTNAGPDQTITLPSTAALDGTVTDDGLPTGSTVTQAWTKVSGPGTVTFGNSAAVDTSASFSTSGSYVLQLTATDGTASSSDQVTVTVNPAPPTNQAPSVNAGPDLTVTLPAGASLDGTVSDDGLPAGSSVTSTWSKVSGPGTVTFGNASAVDTTATFSTSGAYVLKLTATDGTLSSSDQATVTVNPAATGRPLLPYTSSAWIRQTITQLGLTQNAAKTTAMRNYINTSHASPTGEPNLAPNMQGIDGGWADAYGGVATCSDPYFKIGTGTVNAKNSWLKTTGFHAKATLPSDINAVAGTDLPFTVINTCGNSTMPTGFVVKGTGAVTAGGAGTAANPYIINVGGYAGAYDMASNGLNFDVPTSNGPNNWTSRGVIPASADIRADQVQFGINNATDLGQRLELFWWETDSAAGKISPPMAGFESGQSGWGAEGQVVGVNPSFTPAGTCTAGEQVVIRTLKTYGMYIGDNAGNGGTSLKAEQNHGQWTAALGLTRQGLHDDCGLTWNDFVAY